MKMTVDLLARLAKYGGTDTEIQLGIRGEQWYCVLETTLVKNDHMINHVTISASGDTCDIAVHKCYLKTIENGIGSEE